MRDRSLLNRYLKQSRILFGSELFIKGQYSKTELIVQPKIDLLLIGESPYDDDSNNSSRTNKPKKLLNNILGAINKKINRDVEFLTIFKNRPLNNRDPLKSEVSAFEINLLPVIKSITPKLILALGKVTGKALLKKNFSLTEMREKTHLYNGIPLRVTYDPQSILKNLELKKLTWKDFQWVSDFLKN